MRVTKRAVTKRVARGVERRIVVERGRQRAAVPARPAHCRSYAIPETLRGRSRAPRRLAGVETREARDRSHRHDAMLAARARESGWGSTLRYARSHCSRTADHVHRAQVA